MGSGVASIAIRARLYHKAVHGYEHCFFQAEDGIRDLTVTGVQTCALPISQKHGAEHFRRAREQNPEGRIPVSVAIGTDPATALAGMLPIPPDLDEMMFAGFLRRGVGRGSCWGRG